MPVGVSDSQFEQMIGAALDALPPLHASRLQNVAVTYADQPNQEQRRRLRLRCDQTLFGLYEGVPLNRRSSGYNLALPDKITLFKGPLAAVSADVGQLRLNIRRTLWHEVAHYFGLDHDQIKHLETGQ